MPPLREQRRPKGARSPLRDHTRWQRAPLAPMMRLSWSSKGLASPIDHLESAVRFPRFPPIRHRHDLPIVVYFTRQRTSHQARRAAGGDRANSPEVHFDGRIPSLSFVSTLIGGDPAPAVFHTLWLPLDRARNGFDQRFPNSRFFWIMPAKASGGGLRPPMGLTPIGTRADDRRTEPPPTKKRLHPADL